MKLIQLQAQWETSAYLSQNRQITQIKNMIRYTLFYVSIAMMIKSSNTHGIVLPTMQQATIKKPQQISRESTQDVNLTKEKQKVEIQNKPAKINLEMLKDYSR